jgi:DnaK suppressor protein
MTHEQLDHFRRLLLAQRDETNGRILSAQHQAEDVIDPTEDPEDQELRSDIADSALRLGTMRTEQEHAISDALLRIERCEYGVCQQCGEPIELERLDAVPTATLCAEDARRADRSRPPTL